jgi:hypothetical protein
VIAAVGVRGIERLVGWQLVDDLHRHECCERPPVAVRATHVQAHVGVGMGSKMIIIVLPESFHARPTPTRPSASCRVIPATFPPSPDPRTGCDAVDWSSHSPLTLRR